jgi:hypothetical protein
MSILFCFVLFDRLNQSRNDSDLYLYQIGNRFKEILKDQKNYSRVFMLAKDLVDQACGDD